MASKLGRFWTMSIIMNFLLLALASTASNGPNLIDNNAPAVTNGAYAELQDLLMNNESTKDSRISIEDVRDVNVEDNKGFIGFVTDVVAAGFNITKIIAKIIKIMIETAVGLFQLTNLAWGAPGILGPIIGLLVFLWQITCYWKLTAFVFGSLRQ